MKENLIEAELLNALKIMEGVCDKLDAARDRAKKGVSDVTTGPSGGEVEVLTEVS